MRLTQIITMANETVRLRFVALERSLRAVGCDLPLRVIPYDDHRFPLPPNATWWECPSLFRFLADRHAHPTMRKYLCLTAGEYQFVDADVIFLRNPVDVLSPHAGWITSCGSWRDPAHIVTKQLEQVWAQKTALWHQYLFNSGQFACDRPLYDVTALMAAVADPEFRETTLELPYHEQPGLNLLVAASDVPISNLTLPPTRMESTWAGDYPGPFQHLWRPQQRQPYLLHWAGLGYRTNCAIDALYLQFFTTDERVEWDAQVARRRRNRRTLIARTVDLKHRLGLAVRTARAALRGDPAG